MVRNIISNSLFQMSSSSSGQATVLTCRAKSSSLGAYKKLSNVCSSVVLRDSGCVSCDWTCSADIETERDNVNKPS